MYYKQHCDITIRHHDYMTTLQHDYITAIKEIDKSQQAHTPHITTNTIHIGRLQYSHFPRRY